MDNKDPQSFREVREMADSLPYGSERTLLRERSINLADLYENESQQFRARMDFVNDVCYDGGFSEKYFTVFPWLLNYVKNKGSEMDKLTVLWYYKWVIGVMPNFPTVTKKQIAQALEDLRQKYLEFGSNEKVYHDYSRDTYLYLGDFEKSAEHQKQWMKFRKRDQLDDCEACVINRNVTYHILTGHLKKALKIAEPILEGQLSCTHVPTDTYGNFLLPLLKAGNDEMADEFASKVARKISSKKFGRNHYLAFRLLIWLTKRQEFAKALKLIDKYFGAAEKDKSLDARFYFFIGVQYALQHWPKATIKLKLPPTLPFHHAANVYEVKTLVEWLDSETDRLSTLFDKRNENDYISRQKKEYLAL